MSNLTVVANTHAIQERYYDALSWVNRGPEELTARLKLMIQNGKQLQDHEARALAQFAIATGLNPLNQECYFIPGVGPGPGVMGYRRRAMETLSVKRARQTVRLGFIIARSLSQQRMKQTTKPLMVTSRTAANSWIRSPKSCTSRI